MVLKNVRHVLRFQYLLAKERICGIPLPNSSSRLKNDIYVSELDAMMRINRVVFRPPLARLTWQDKSSPMTN